MDCSTGWLLDVSIEQNRAKIWIKTSEGTILKLIDNYQPSFYVLPKDEYAGADLFHILSQQSIVKKVEWEDKFTDLFDYDRHGMKKLICVYTESILYHKTLLKNLEKNPRVVQLFNTDLSHIQQYLFTKLKVKPTSKVEVQYDKNESRLIKITKIIEEEKMELLRRHFQFCILKFTQHRHRTILAVISMTRSQRSESDIKMNRKSLEGSENAILQSFCEYIQAKDPGILFSLNQYSRSTTTFDYLFMKMTRLGLDLDFGRDNKTNKTNKIEGRVYLSNKSFHSNLDLVGLIEKAQFGFLPLSWQHVMA